MRNTNKNWNGLIDITTSTPAEGHLECLNVELCALTMVSMVNPARFNRLPRSCTEVNGDMCGANP